MNQDLLDWRQKYEDLEGESKKLYAEMKAELEEKDEIISDLSRANEELESYVDILMKSEGIA